MNVNLPAVFVFLLIFFHQEVVHAQEATENRPIINPLALGGMVQGLLDMQIRPQGGFYEDRYKDLFPENINVPLATTTEFDRRHTVSNSLRTKGIISEDGRLLIDAASGKSANPCFDQRRIARNRLLFLICSMQQANVQLSDN